MRICNCPDCSDVLYPVDAKVGKKKKIVHFYKIMQNPIVGHHAYVGTVDHTSPRVTNYGDGWV